MIIKSFTYIENISISFPFLNNTCVMCQGFVVYLAWLLLINVRIHDLITSQLCCKLHYRLRKTMTWLYSDLNSQPYIFVTKEWNGISYPEAHSTEGALARVCQNSYSCNTNFCNALISVANDVLCIINIRWIPY